MNQLSILPFMPLDPAWIEQHPAFCHDDPRLAKAALQLLFAAWRGVPAGSIPSSQAYVAQATGLPREVVAQHFVLLTEGFFLGEDGRLHHGPLAQVTSALTDRYGKEIEQYGYAMAMAAQDPEEFAVAGVEARSAKKPRGMTLIPRDFGWQYLPGMEEFLEANGYPAANQRKWLMQEFMDYCSSRGIKSRDWAAEFRRFASSTLDRFGDRIPAPELPVDLFDAESSQKVTQGAFGRFGGRQAGPRSVSRGEAATNHNLNAFARRAG
jgi:hypothetical protein